MFPALEVEDDAHTVAIALVTDIGDAFHLLAVDEGGSVLDQPRFVYLVGNLGDNDGGSFLANLLRPRSRPDRKMATTSFVSADDAFSATDRSPGGKVGTLNDL